MIDLPSAADPTHPTTYHHGHPDPSQTVGGETKPWRIASTRLHNPLDCLDSTTAGKEWQAAELRMGDSVHASMCRVVPTTPVTHAKPAITGYRHTGLAQPPWYAI